MTLIHHLDTNSKRTVELRIIHGLTVEKVFSATSHLTIDNTFHPTEIIVNTNIYDTQLETVLSAKHIDSTAAMSEIYHLLPCDLTRRRADTLTLYAMVTTKEQMTGMAQ